MNVIAATVFLALACGHQLGDSPAAKPLSVASSGAANQTTATGEVAPDSKCRCPASADCVKVIFADSAQVTDFCTKIGQVHATTCPSSGDTDEQASGNGWCISQAAYQAYISHGGSLNVQCEFTTCTTLDTGGTHDDGSPSSGYVAPENRVRPAPCNGVDWVAPENQPDTCGATGGNMNAGTTLLVVEKSARSDDDGDALAAPEDDEESKKLKLRAPQGSRTGECQKCMSECDDVCFVGLAETEANRMAELNNKVEDLTFATSCGHAYLPSWSPCMHTTREASCRGCSKECSDQNKCHVGRCSSYTNENEEDAGDHCWEWACGVATPLAKMRCTAQDLNVFFTDNPSESAQQG